MKIAVMLSGGVDSAAAAHLLKRGGADITCFTLRLFDDDEFGFPVGSGMQKQIEKAKIIAEKLELPHKIIDFRKEFKKEIVSYFSEKYQKGMTPNPCIECNFKIKWGKALEYIKKKGFQKIASGHYATLIFNDKKYKVYNSKDESKDQTYLLWQLNQYQLKNMLFPLQAYKKPQIIDMMNTEYGMNSQAESQDICFIYKDYRSLLKEFFGKQKSGDVIFDKKKIGEHSGCFNYTIGQRRGLNLPHRSPFYVKNIDINTNKVFITDDIKELYFKQFFIKNINWINGVQPKCKTLFVKIRYKTTAKKVKKLIPKKDGLLVKMEQRIKSPTFGQSAVFYQKNQLMGGGIISP